MWLPLNETYLATVWFRLSKETRWSRFRLNGDSRITLFPEELSLVRLFFLFNFVKSLPSAPLPPHYRNQNRVTLKRIGTVAPGNSNFTCNIIFPGWPMKIEREVPLRHTRVAHECVENYHTGTNVSIPTAAITIYCNSHVLYIIVGQE